MTNSKKQNLYTDIRIARLSLNMDPYISLNGLSIADLEGELKILRTEQRAVGGILKDHIKE